MPCLSEWQRLLGDLASAHLDLQLTHYQDLLQTVVDLHQQNSTFPTPSFDMSHE